MEFSRGKPRSSRVYLTSPCALLRFIAKSCESRRVRSREERKWAAGRKASSD